MTLDILYRTNIFLLAQKCNMECHKFQFLGQLFLLYVNDLLNIQKIKTVFYADDTNITVTKKKIYWQTIQTYWLPTKNENVPKHKIQNIREKLQSWFHISNLTINIEKMAMSFHTRQNRNPLK